MKKKNIFFPRLMSIALAITLCLVTTNLASVEEPVKDNLIKTNQIKDFDIVYPLLDRDACTLSYTTGSIAGYFSGFTTGMAILTYFDPSSCAGTPTYPFEIQSIDLTLWDSGTCTWPIQVDFVVYEMAISGDPCAGPGIEHCRETFTCDYATFAYPNIGTLSFSSPCCVDEPFFAGIEYSDSGTYEFPSVLFDDQQNASIPCYNWFNYYGTWYEWYNIWSPPTPGYPLYWVNGETDSDNCNGEPWPNHKMHYPQLPDPFGWDVYATYLYDYNGKLADDWMCTESGDVTDIHFWGSWLTDIIGTLHGFYIAIHADIPDGPGGYSIPGEELWGQYFNDTDFEVTLEFDSPQGWYDPYPGVVYWLNHYYCFRYDITNIIDPFYQENGTIYWLAITANVSNASYPGPLWGWKTSLDHWNDNAVWTVDLVDEWYPLWEPYDWISNYWWAAFDFDWLPIPEYMGGTDYFDDGASLNGWYEYPSGWWNIWFYDHPLDYDRMKQIYTYFWVAPFFPEEPGWIEIAINYATDLWSEEGTPDEPPLPGVDEDLYIERIIVYEGYVFEPMEFLFPYEILEYNPEWVSIDVTGYNFIIAEGEGEIHHACYGPLDLAFVITGEEQPCEPNMNVTKKVYDYDAMEFVDYLDLPVGSIAEFSITIENTGTCCNLTNITIIDIVDPSFVVVDYTDAPIISDYDPVNGTTVEWTYNGPLLPGETITYGLWVNVLGPYCHEDYNVVNVSAYCPKTNQTIYRDDWAAVHATGGQEYGDAPEGLTAIAYPSTGVTGSFPTCQCCGPAGFIQHYRGLGGGIFFGPMADYESDGNAGLCPLDYLGICFPFYDMDEGFFGDPDAGLMWPEPYTITPSYNVVPLIGTGVALGQTGQTGVWGGNIDMLVNNFIPFDAYVNVLADWNQNGQWGDDPTEHILVDFTIPTGFSGPISILAPPAFTIGPNPGFVWTRFSITEYPVTMVYPYPWNGEGIFEDGETEDYMLLIEADDPPTACYTWSDADGSGAGTTIDFDASCSTDDYGITTYDWDWTNDGSYDHTGGPTASYNYGDTNTHTCKLRVTDTSGQTDTYTDTVQAIAEALDVDQSLWDRGFRVMPGWDGAQEFEPNYDYLSRVDVYMTEWGSPWGPIVFQICEGTPDGTVVATDSIDPSVVPSYPTFAWITVDITDIAVTAGDTYVIVLRDGDLGDDHNCLMWFWCDSYGGIGPYPNGEFLFRKLFYPTWVPIHDWDYTFKTYGYD